MNPLLSEKEVNYWRLRTIHWFELIATKPEIETKYITNVLIEEFIEQTVEKVKTTLEDWDAKLLLDCYF